MLILGSKPEINKQFDNFTNILKLHNSRSEHKRIQQTQTQINKPGNTTEIHEIIEETQPENHPSNTPIMTDNNEPQDIIPLNIQNQNDQTEDPVDSPNPFGQFSQRTLRLLNSPININRLKIDPVNKHIHHKDNSNTTHQRNSTQEKTNSDFTSTTESSKEEVNLEENIATTQNSMPNMANVLSKFGINNNTQDNTTESQNIDIQDTDPQFTISQRIKTLRRATTKQPFIEEDYLDFLN